MILLLLICLYRVVLRMSFFIYSFSKFSLELLLLDELSVDQRNQKGQFSDESNRKMDWLKFILSVEIRN